LDEEKDEAWMKKKKGPSFGREIKELTLLQEEC
jgi:hypothetical protein